MTVLEALQRSLGDPERFGSLSERIEVLIESQALTWAEGMSSWLVAPLDRHPSGFYLLSEDREGQRRGREVLQAFLGPSSADIQTMPLAANGGDVDRLLDAAGLIHLSYVRRTATTQEDFLERLEDAVATVKGKDARLRPVRRSHVDLLRDFRLALLQRDSRLAEQALTDLRLTGQLSAENLRFLTIKLLGRLERWRELRNLPYLTDLLRSRRPRAINEVLLEMLWRTEVAELCATGQPAQAVYAEADLGARYGTVLSAVDVPVTEAGRAVSVVAARALNDIERLQRLLLAADSDLERERLQRLSTLEASATPDPTTVQNDVQGLFDKGQYGAAVLAFLESPDPSVADLVVQATLDSEDSVHAPDVLTTIQAFITDNLVHPDRRLLRDLEDLTQLVDGSCTSWVEWCTRIGQNERWPDATQVLRTQHQQWDSMQLLTPAKVRQAADGVLSAWTGINQDQIVAGLDVLCRAAAEAALATPAAEFCDSILLVLAEQQNLSAPVREAYLVLLDQLLESGPTEARYRDTLQHAISLWRRISAPVAVDWGLGLVDILLNAPVPAADARVAVVTEVLNKVRDFQQRLNSRQNSELEALAEEIGLPVRQLPKPAEGVDLVWHRLNGTIVGVYSLLPRAAESLSKRLSRLCSPGAIEGNADTVATPALRALTTRADYLIVDTWHAAHAATSAIDAVRPRDQQILPKGRGITGFLQALEQSLLSG